MRFVVSRLAGALLTLLVGAVVIFFVVRLIPGDPVATILSREFDPEVAESLRRLYGLDRPIPEQFASWITAVAQGDWGFSMLNRAPVAEQVIQRVPRTIYLLVGGVGLALLVAIPAGVIAASARGRWPDVAVTVGTTLGLSVPQFWVGILLIVVFAVQLRWLPAAGYVDPGQDLIGSLRSMILPWVTVALTMAAFVTRVLRSSLVDVMGRDFIRTARSRGNPERRVISHHAFRNAMIPSVTIIGLEVGYLMGGAIIVEKVFSYPGMGQLITNAIIARDYPVIQISLLFFVLAFVVANFLTDVAYAVLDPRLRR